MKMGIVPSPTQYIQVCEIQVQTGAKAVKVRDRNNVQSGKCKKSGIDEKSGRRLGVTGTGETREIRVYSRE